MSKKRGFLYRLGYTLERGRIAFLEGFYAAHVKIRYLHDKTYLKGPKWYRSWSNKSYSDTIHKTTLWGFIISFIVFSFLQNMLPYLFNPGRPQIAMAGTNNKTWTTNADFAYNKSSLCGATTVSTNALISGAAYTDGTCAAQDTDSSVTIKSSTAIAHEASASARPTFSTYTDGTYVYFVGATATETQLRVEKRNASDLTLVTSFGTSGVKTVDQSALNDDYYDVTGDDTYLYVSGLSYAQYASVWRPRYFVAKVSKADGTTTQIYKDNTLAGVMRGITTDGTNLYGVGNEETSYGNDYKIFKMSKAGALDGTFGGGIITVSGFSSTSSFLDRIYYDSGYIYVQVSDQTGARRLEKRSATDGSLVGTFGTNGVIIDDNSGQPNSNGMVTDANYLYTAWGNWIEKRDKNTGAYVSAFGISGKVDGTASAITYSDLVIDGSYLIVAGQKNTAGNLNWRFEKRNITDGSLDTTFGTNGYIDRDYGPGAGGDIVYKLVKSGSNYFAAGSGNNVWQGAHISTAYQSPGSITGFKVNGGVGTKSKWTNVSWVLGTALPANSTVSFKARGTNVASPTGGTPIDQANPDNGWTTLADLTGVTSSDATHYSGTVATTATTWLEIQLTLTSSNGVSTPTLDSFRVDYNSLDAPTTLTAYKTDGTQISAGAYINQMEAKLKADLGVPFSPSSSNSPITTELEVRNADSGWTGAVAYPTGVSATPGSITYSCSSDPCTALGVKDVGTLYNLAPGTYYYRVRAKDGSGRVSPWSASSSSFRVETTLPTISSFTLSGANINGSFAKGRDVTLNITAGDTGGSGLTEVRYANEDNVWSGWEPITSPATKAWTLTDGDGVKKVYAQVRDGAGNIANSWNQTAQADFDSAGGVKTNTDTSATPGTIKLSNVSQNATVRPAGPGLYAQFDYQQPGTGAHWDKVDDAIVDGSDYVYTATAGQKEMYPITASGIPVGSTINSVKVYANMDPGLDCCTVPVVKLGVYDGTGESWGTLDTGVAGEYNYTFAVNPRTGSAWTLAQINSLQIGSMLDTYGDYAYTLYQLYAVVNYTSGYPTVGDNNYISAIRDNTTARDYGHIVWNADVPSQTGANALRFQVAANNDNSTWNYTGPDGTAGTYYNSGDQLWSGLSGNRYIRYKAYLATANSSYTPTVYDVNLEVLSSVATTTLDTAAPTAFSLTTPADNTWYGTASPTLNWNPSTDPSGIDYYQLYIDDTLSRNNIAGLSTTPSSPLAEGMHAWYVKAVDSAGNGTNSTQTLHVGYDATTPAAPASFTATGGTDTITLNWSFSNNNGSPINKVIVERIDWTSYDPAHPTDPWNSYLSYKYKEYDGGTTSAVYSVSDIDPVTKIAQGRRYAYRIAAKDSINSAYGTYSSVRSGLTEDSVFDATINNVTVSPCDGASNCSTKTGIPHKGFETKITWDPAVDSGLGTSHYLVYRSETDLNSGNYTDVLARNSYQIVGVLPYLGGGQQPAWYDNNANNDGTTTFYDANGATITIPAEIQALTAKTVASPRLDDYHLYYYRVVGVDANNNKSSIFAESPTSGEFDVLKAHRNGNVGADAERTPDVTAPEIPGGHSVVPSGIDTLNSQPDPTQGMIVSWNPSIDNSGRTVTYRLFRNLGTISGPGGQWDEITLPDGGAVTSYQDEGLQQDTYYYYKISAKDPDNNESAECISNTPVKTKNSQVPTTPSYVTIRATKGNPSNSNVGHEISVSFNGSAIRYSTNHVTGYEVYRSTTNFMDEASWLALTPVKTFTGINYAGYDGNITYDVTRSFTDTVTDTDGAKTYFYKVRAMAENSDGPVVSGLSAIQTGTIYYGWDTTPDIKAPALPADVKVKDIHDDGVSFKRNIITWARIANPDRNGANDFKEYRIYRSDDGITWQQICQNGTTNILRNACDAEYPNPLYNANQNIGLATNYYMDLIPIASANQYYYYHVTAADDAKDSFKYFDNSVINNYSNESPPEIGSNGAIVSVSLNPAIAKPSICNVGSSPCTSTAGVTKAVLSEVGVASATIAWTTDQPTDSIVEFKRSGTNDAYIGTIDRGMTTNHTLTIKPLSPNTSYDYRVISRNSLANDATAQGSEVPTLTTTGFNIATGAVVTTTSTAEISWATNLDATSAIVEYQLQRQPGDEAQSGVAGASAENLAANPRSHKVIIKGLRSNRTYTYKIKSISKDNFLAEYPQNQFSNFKTKAFDSEQFTLAPSSSNIAERNITSTTAQIIWQTGNPTTSWVDYGTKPGIYDISAGDNNLTTAHVVVLNGLVPGNRYYYRVRVKDTNEVEYNSQEYTFMAVLKPKISGLTISNVTPYSVTISWSTNVETETLMNWGTTKAYGTKRGNAQISNSHSVTIDNLEDNTEYHYQILAHDQAGNEVADEDRNVRTPLDTAGPKISDVKNDILLNEANNTAQVIISWKTDKPATTFVQYDEGMLGGKYTKASVEDPGLSNAHTVIIKDLDPGITYHYRIVTKDKRGNETISNDYTFITPAAEKSILQLILKSLEETFSWVGNVGKYFSSLGKKTK